MNSESTSGATSNLWCTDCEKKPATQLNPFLLCDSCYANRYSTQIVDGKRVPFKEALKASLIKQGLWFKDGETRGDWYERMATVSRSTLREFARGKTSEVGVHQKEYARDSKIDTPSE